MRRLFVLGALLLATASITRVAAGQSDTAIELNAVEAGGDKLKTTKGVSLKSQQAEPRRSAYLGILGSFTLIGSKGTAAYVLGNDRRIADLTFVRDDLDWWVYRPTATGDLSTRAWAFAKHPGFCGKYRVLRFADGAWQDFDLDDAWGLGLGSSIVRAAPAESEANLDQILGMVRDIKEKVDVILQNTSKR